MKKEPEYRKIKDQSDNFVINAPLDFDGFNFTDSQASEPENQAVEDPSLKLQKNTSVIRQTMFFEKSSIYMAPDISSIPLMEFK